MKTKKFVIEQSATGEVTYARRFIIELSATNDPEGISLENLERLAEHVDGEWQTWEVQDDTGPSDCVSAYVIGEADEADLSTLRTISVDEVTRMISDSEVSP